MKYFIFIISILTYLSIGTFGNNTRQKEALQTDTLEYCEEIVNEVDALKLYCDTVFSYSLEDIEYYQLKVIYFDENKKLRKYWRKEEGHDGAAECIDMKAYYDQSGNLVHINIESSYHCGYDNEYFYVYNGRVVDYDYSGGCHCCDEEEEESSDSENSKTEDEEQKSWYPTDLPVKGDTINETVGWEFTLKHFIYADSLIKRLKSDNYYNNGEFSDD